MTINCIYGMSYDSNIYIITGKKPTIIDCGTGLFHNEVIKRIKKLIDINEICQIILTHEHFDHCGGVKKIFELINGDVDVFAHENAVEKIEHGESDFAKMMGGNMPKMHIDVKLNEGDVLDLGDNKFEIIHTPGHTPGCVCLYDKINKSLISGDTIFSFGSFGRYDFPEGNGIQLRQSIERLCKLDVENLYPGHESIVEGNGNKHMKMTLENSRFMIR